MAGLFRMQVYLSYLVGLGSAGTKVMHGTLRVPEKRIAKNSAWGCASGVS